MFPAVFLFVSCIGELDETCDAVDAYVIEATISTCDTIQTINVYDADGYRGALLVDSVVITDDIGGRWKYNNPGPFWSKHYTAWVKSIGWPVVGRTYTLDVCIDGCHYYATETIHPCPEVSRVSEVTTMAKEGFEDSKVAVHFIHDDSDEESFCYFTSAGRVTYFSTKGFNQGENIVVKSDGFGVHHGQPAGQGGTHEIRYDDGYYYRIRVASMSKSNYEFYSALDKLCASDGGVFAGLSEEVPTNFYSEKPVYGQFFATDAVILIGKIEE